MEQPAFYGEILPVVSRAVDDEDDSDIESPANSVSITWSSTVTCKLPCKIFVIALGTEATGFVKAFIIGERKTNTVAVIHLDDTSNSSRCILQLEDQPDVIIVCTENEIEELQTFTWTQEVFSMLDMTAASIVVMSTCFASRYSSECYTAGQAVPFLRSLKTTSFQSLPVAPFIEQPNIVSGLPAQILTYLEINKIPGVLYMCYKDIRNADIQSVKQFREIMNVAPFKDKLVIAKNANQYLVQFAEKHEDRSTLYI